MWELGLILLVALILLGPRQLTETAKVMGRLYREIQRMTSDLRNSVDLDSLTTPTYSQSGEQKKATEADSRYKDQEIVPLAGEKSGPDFYAELLESSETDDEKKQVPDSATESPERVQDNEQEDKSSSEGKNNHKKERT